MKQKQIRCPYCGSIAILRDASYVYGNKAKDGKLYVCSHFPQCNSYVGSWHYQCQRKTGKQRASAKKDPSTPGV